MKFFLDTEFHEKAAGQVELISLALVSEDLRELYIELQFDEEAVRNSSDQRVANNVLPHLEWPAEDRLTLDQARQAVEDFMGPGMALPPRSWVKPEIWAYYASTDWVLFYRLWGRMVDMPRWMPFHPMCLQQWWIHLGRKPHLKPPDPENEHNALADARWNRDFYWSLTR